MGRSGSQAGLITGAEGKAISKERLAAFSDGVIAIIITIMVLEIKVPQGAGLASLRPLLPVLLSYILSFVYVGIYWNNHHHFLAATERVSGAVLWANLHLLFWLSLVPLTTEWMGQHPLAPAPTVVYGVFLLGASLAFWLFQRTLVTTPGQSGLLAAALGNDIKGKLSPLLYAAAILIAFFLPALADMLYVCVALLWLIPDRRMERAVTQQPDGDGEEDALDKKGAAAISSLPPSE